MTVLTPPQMHECVRRFISKLHSKEIQTVDRPEFARMFRWPVLLTEELNAAVQAAIDDVAYRSWEGYVTDLSVAVQFAKVEHVVGWKFASVLLDGEERRIASGIYFPPNAHDENIVFAFEHEVLADELAEV